MSSNVSEETTEEDILEDDYYGFLNLSKTATADEITTSFRRLSKLYHPDKHTDPVLKKNAEHLFNKVKTAYEVLNDPQKRAIYDTLGVKGLETDGWQIVERTKTAREIREEYEQLLKEKEERLMQQRTNPKSAITVLLNATDLFEHYDFDYRLPALEIAEMSISQSVEAPMEPNQTLTLHGGLSSQNGTGTGRLNCGIRRIISANTWIEGGISAGNGLMFNMKGTRTFSKYFFATAQTHLRFTDSAISPGLELMMSRQLTKNTSGYITWKQSNNTSLICTTIAHDTEKSRYATSIQLGKPQSFISFAYIKKLEDEGKLRGVIKIGVLGALIEYGIEKKISQYSIASAAMVVGVPYGVTLKLKISRSNVTFSFPILLSQEVLPSAIFYGTVTPIVGWYILKKFYIEPHNRRQKERELEKKKEANAQRIAERRREASIAVSLMQETYTRIKSEEERRNGLIIKMALYGSSEHIANINIEQQDSQLEVLNATVQLQCLVKDSRLILPDRSKSSLPGFYDPCLGEEKCLRVDYVYRNRNHSITVADDQMLRIPRMMDS